MHIGVDFDGTIVHKVDQTLITGVRDCLGKWMGKTHKVTIVTDRCPTYLPYIKQTIFKNFGSAVMDKLTYVMGTGTPGSKIEKMNALELDLMIDDTPLILENANCPGILLADLENIQPESAKFLWKRYVHVDEWGCVDKLVNTRKLLTPGPVRTSLNLEIDFSHRGDRMQELMCSVQKKLRQVFSIPDQYGVVLAGGSATTALETVLASMVGFRTVGVLVDGEFGQRLEDMARFYAPRVVSFYHLKDLEQAVANHQLDVAVVTQFETSVSRYHDLVKLSKLCQENGTKLIVDAVSSFGYYPMVEASVVVTSSSKLIGAAPTLGIILYDRQLKFQERSYTLSMNRLIHYSQPNQPPHTSLIPQIYSLEQALNWCTPSAEVSINQKAFEDSYAYESSFMEHNDAPVGTYPLPSSLSYEELGMGLEKHRIELYFGKKYLQDKKVFQVAFFGGFGPEVYRWAAVVLNHLEGRWKK
jgi:2-aminoethylphosphonate-pyruvate transaminase